MDHFCPWVGGIVSETSFKFFIQFLFYTALFTTHTLIFSAYFLAERQRRGYRLDVHWLLLVVFAAMFWLFSAGMCTSSMQFAMLNVTTIENFDRRGKVWYLCVFLPRPEETLSHLERSGRMVPRTIPYPRPAEETAMLMQDALNVENANRPAGTALPVPDLPPTQATRVFAILELPAGANPWDCGPLANVKEVLGYSLLEWLLPVKRSPCARHVDPESTCKLGPAVGRVMREAGLVEDDGSVGGDVAGKKKKRRRRRSTAEGADREGESGTDRRRRDRRKRRDRGRSEPGARSRPRSREGA
jgi:palmitoyltransferase